MATVYLNGEFIEENAATISVYDRGFLFADAVYEVIPVYGRRCFKATSHLIRLENSLKALGIANPLSNEQWLTVFDQLIEQCPADDQCIYLQVSRGSTGSRDHDLPTNIQPTVFANTKALAPVPKSIIENGVDAILLDDIRWQWCHIKSTALLANILLKKQASEAGANEALLHRDGRLTEGASSNVFAVINGAIATPPTNGELLPGITREVVIDVLKGIGLNVDIREIDVAELQQAEEIWISSSTRELYPVTKLDQQPVGTGLPGPIWQKAFAAIQDYKQAFRLSSNYLSSSYLSTR